MVRIVSMRATTDVEDLAWMYTGTSCPTGRIASTASRELEADVRRAVMFLSPYSGGGTPGRNRVVEGHALDRDRVGSRSESAARSCHVVRWRRGSGVGSKSTQAA